jgi:hypothetical protein
MSWRRFDFNLKGVEGIQERTIGGGVVTLVSFVVVAFLLLSELSIWWSVEVTHRMHVDTASVRVRLSLPHNGDDPVHSQYVYGGESSKTRQSQWTSTSPFSTRNAQVGK